VFFFGDAIEENEEALFDESYKWLRQIREHYFFLNASIIISVVYVSFLVYGLGFG